MIRRTPRSAAIALLVVALAAAAHAQPSRTGASPDAVWQSTGRGSSPLAPRPAGQAGPDTLVRLDRRALDTVLDRAPRERVPAGRQVLLALPLPDGRFGRFAVEESPILSPALAAAFPDIKTYRGIGVDDRTASARFDVTAAGFHAQILSAEGTFLVDPVADGDLVNHVAYAKADRSRSPAPAESMGRAPAATAQRTYNQLPIANGASLRTYRLAVAAAGEYTLAAGGTKPLALARITTTMNRVNGIYERELAMRFTVITGSVADPTALIFLDPAIDPYNDQVGAGMPGENQVQADLVVGSANYDVGHVFGRDAGRVADIGVACQAATKARGASGSLSSSGDAFDVDYVAHGLAHQFGGNHTFNSTSGACAAPARSASHAFEAGGGSTILGLAGACGPEDTQLQNSDILNVESLDEITAYITSGAGATCGAPSATGNTPPTVTGPGATFTIPVGTPFALQAGATDPNGDTLTYLWEEHDLGNASAGGTAGTDDGSRPLFRTYTPSTSPVRYFPSLTYILNNASTPPATYACGASTCIVGEVLPALGRTMTFDVTVRDNRAGGGGIGTAQTQVVVNGAVGPFAVTSPNAAVTWTGFSFRTITWSVLGSNALAANVKISLSTDGGATFPAVLAASTPNDGSETVLVPNTATTTGRIKVEAVGNIFFDLSDANLTITPVVCAYSVTPTSASYDANGGGGTVAVSAPAGCGWIATNNAPAFLAITAGATGTGNGSLSYTVAPNPSTSPRSGTFALTGGATFTVNQTGCTYGLTPTATTFGGSGGAGAVTVVTQSACGWNVTGPPAWASTTSGGSGTGLGAWRYTVAANGGAARSQNVTIGGQTFVLGQLQAGVDPKVLTPGTRASFTLANAAAQSLALVEAEAGRSYCVLVAPGPTATSAASPTLTVLRADFSTVLAGGAPGTRVCFVAPASETTFVRVTQADAAPRAHLLSVNESTLWANWWFIGGDYSSFTLLRNTTGTAINATVTWRTDVGVAVGTQHIVIPAGGVFIGDARGNVSSGTAGSVEVGHDGEPQGLVLSQTTLSTTSGLSFDTIGMQRGRW